ncbi:Isochorismatase hydrolase [Vararia minispora EC-137]|uniref:Isochorismatase hydrolase n=1 Tax=Vararia minispora EC-137 TaxID=1314806 RepID=A0ACB8QMF9_9AGAM|nr:Isochorismatase hydrolase [Vararia minispora EC-137]
MSSSTPPPVPPTTAPPPAGYPEANPNKVLLVIDAQVGMLSDPPRGIPNSRKIAENIGTILETARAAPHPPLIVHIRNCGEPGEDDERGSAGWALLHAPPPHEPVIDKLKNNAFAGTSLGDIVKADAHIIVVGCQSDFCIRATCNAAIARGNEIILIHGAHGTYDRVEVLAGGGVTPAKTVEREIEVELDEAGVHLLEMDDVNDLFND